MEANVIIAYVFGLVLLYVMARILFIPLKYVGRLLINAGVGLLLLALFNLVGGYFDLYIPLNPVTALVAGFLGVPGVVLLVLLRHVILGLA